MSSVEKRQENHKFDAHTSKTDLAHHDHEKALTHKSGSSVRMERHSGTGRPMREQPKKGGAGGKGTWGTWEDDVLAEDDAAREYESA